MKGAGRNGIQSTLPPGTESWNDDQASPFTLRGAHRTSITVGHHLGAGTKPVTVKPIGQFHSDSPTPAHPVHRQLNRIRLSTKGTHQRGRRAPLSRALKYGLAGR